MIYGKRIRLAAPERKDLPLFVEWLNDPEVRHGLSAYLPISDALEDQWYENLLKRPRDSHPMCIQVKEGDSWITIGNMGLFDINPRDRSAEVGIMIGNKNYWNKGYGTEAMQLITKISAISKIPALIAWMSSPKPGASITRVVCASRAISTSA